MNPGAENAAGPRRRVPKELQERKQCRCEKLETKRRQHMAGREIQEKRQESCKIQSHGRWR